MYHGGSRASERGRRIIFDPGEILGAFGEEGAVATATTMGVEIAIATFIRGSVGTREGIHTAIGAGRRNHIANMSNCDITALVRAGSRNIPIGYFSSRVGYGIGYVVMIGVGRIAFGEVDIIRTHDGRGLGAGAAISGRIKGESTGVVTAIVIRNNDGITTGRQPGDEVGAVLVDGATGSPVDVIGRVAVADIDLS